MCFAAAGAEWRARRADGASDRRGAGRGAQRARRRESVAGLHHYAVPEVSSSFFQRKEKEKTREVRKLSVAEFNKRKRAVRSRVCVATRPFHVCVACDNTQLWPG